MSINLNVNIPADGDPEGLIDAPQGALFFKNNIFYKLNLSGSLANTWQDVNFQRNTIPSYYLTEKDVELLSCNTGSYLYVKTTVAGTPYGWEFLSNQSPFISTI